MPKIPTFTAQGSIEQLQGSTQTPQIKLTSTLANALAPVTKMVCFSIGKFIIFSTVSKLLLIDI